MALLSIKSIKDRIVAAEKRLAMKRGASGLAVFVWNISEAGVPSRNYTLFPGNVAIPGASQMHIIGIPRGKFLAPGNATVAVPIDAPADAALGEYQGIFDLTDEIELMATTHVAKEYVSDAMGQKQLFNEIACAAVDATGPVLRVPKIIDAPNLVHAPLPKLKVSKATGETIVPEKAREPTFMDDPVKRDDYLAKMAEEFSAEKIEQRRAEREAETGQGHTSTADDLAELQQALDRSAAGTVTQGVNPVVQMKHGGTVAAGNAFAIRSPSATVHRSMTPATFIFIPSEISPVEL